MTIELERSYIFPHESIPHIVDFLGATIEELPLDLRDYYLNPNLRVRSTTLKKHDQSDFSTIQLTRKDGDKGSGRRTEENRTGEIHDIAERIYAFLQWHGIPHVVAEQGDARRILGSLFYMNETGKERWE
ncbi:MAG: hypothetical protein DRJ03_00750 [Chloroflexi bacterium]|nr:MAG: hypothetical protein DRJ03_00750 [Chloroflexota bacterium]